MNFVSNYVIIPSVLLALRIVPVVVVKAPLVAPVVQIE
jgi:hypothetical protein